MKKILLILFTVAIFNKAFAQSEPEKFDKIMFSIGLDKAFIDATSFDNWLAMHHTNKQLQDVTGNFDVSLATRKYDMGVSAVFPDPYSIGSIYFGQRLTPLHKKFNSFLNLHVGYFDALYDHTSPSDITAPAGSTGKSTLLEYNSGYIGLSLKNYFTTLFKKGGSSNFGFDVDAGYITWTTGWKYGYFAGNSGHTHFHGNHIKDIPSPSKVFVNFSIFYGLGTL